jgi:Yippee zinc-binding/DNA-binding /Mis18, centromere assembly
MCSLTGLTDLLLYTVAMFFRTIAGFFNRVNVTLGKREHRSLITGMHVVADIFCTVCENAVGWKYVCAAASPSLLNNFVSELM